VRNGRLPSLAKGWQWRKFGDCARFINGRAYSQEELLGSGTPVLRIQNLNGGNRWYYSNLKLPPEKYCDAGDLLYAWSASFGPYRFTGPKSIFHYHIWRVIPGAGLDKNFAFHLLEEITNAVKSAAHGVAMLHMTKSGIEGWSVPLPPLVEQRRIARVLDSAEALRAKRRAGLFELGSLTRSVFLDLFGDPATNPKGWPVLSIGDLLESASYGTSEKSGAAGEFPVLRMNNIMRTGEMDFTDLKFMDLEASQYDRYLVRAGDVLFNRTNSADLVGKTGVFRESKPMAYAGYLIRLRMTEENHPEFLSAFLNSGYSKRMLRGMCKSIIGMANINATEIQAMRIPRPPLPLQREFARRVRAVEKLKTAQRASLAELDALFATLQHRAFRGEL
jgi:type I restriction enzyme S subunit